MHWKINNKSETGVIPIIVSPSYDSIIPRIVNEKSQQNNGIMETLKLL